MTKVARGRRAAERIIEKDPSVSGTESDKIYIVGIGEDGLSGVTDFARRVIEEADVLIGESHALALVGETKAEQITTPGELSEIAATVNRYAGRKIVLLAIGDPLFYGVARYLCDRLGKDRFEVLPHVSTMQLAFARVKESWEEAYLTNLANRPLEDILDVIAVAEKVGLFTTETYPPAAVAKALLSRGIDTFTVYVCENLGSPDERVTCGELAEIADMQFSPLNVMVLVRKPDVPDRPRDMLGRRLFGTPDEVFLQSKPKRCLLTPREIRVIALAELDLGPSSVVWDVGAGSGSVAIEAGQLCRDGTVYAIEMDPDDIELTKENIARFEVKNVVPVFGRAPEAWADLPDPDAVFVGGSGRQVVTLCDQAFARLKPGGRLVVTMGSIDNVADVHRTLRGYCHDVQVLLINVARGNYQLDRVRFQPVSPTFLVSVVKPMK